MQKGFAGIIVLIVVLILAGLAGAYYFGKSQTPKPQNPVVSQVVQPTFVPLSIPTASPAPSAEELVDFPVYPNAIYIGKQPIVPCTNGAEQNGFSTCNAIVYSWKTSDNYDQVTSYYKNAGWICGGAGSYDGPRSASGGGNTCTKNNRHFGAFFDATAQETKIDFALYP